MQPNGCHHRSKIHSVLHVRLQRVLDVTEGRPGNHGPRYHDLLACNDTVFKQNSMSYLRYDAAVIFTVALGL